MVLKELLAAIEEMAPFSLQEDYDNSGLQIGSSGQEVTGCIICLDINEQVVEEAARHGSNLIISHHPLIFKGIKRIADKTATERIIKKALKEDLAICSVHTNLDNAWNGVNRILGEKLGLTGLSVLRKPSGMLKKLATYCPAAHAGRVRQALFDAGAGHIGGYDQCSFNLTGQGTFRGGEATNPFVGEKGHLHFEEEVRIETIFPAYRKESVVEALLSAHPYEEVAYDIYSLENEYDRAGAGMIGHLPEPTDEKVFLAQVKDILKIPVIRHSPLLGKPLRRVAICGGSGSFLIQDAIRMQADIFLTADIKYHQFFEADGKIVIADAGHFETEQFTCGLIAAYLKKKFPTFAIRISETLANPVNYF